MEQTLNDLCGYQDPLRDAIWKEDVSMVESLIKEVGYNENTFTFYARPLDDAIQLGAVEIAKALIETGIDVNIPRWNNLTPLALCANNCYKNSGGMFRMLLDAGAEFNPNEDMGQAILNYTIRYSKMDILEILLENGLNVNCDLGFGTLLEHAVLYGSPEIAKLLIKSGADVEAISERSGTTILMRTAYMRHDLRVLKILIEVGPNIEARDMKGFTPLIHASSRKNLDLVKFFIEEGANVNAKDYQGLSALSHACLNECANNVKQLLEAGADITSTNGNTFVNAQFDQFTFEIIYSLIPYILLYYGKGEKPSNIIEENVLSKLWDDCKYEVEKLQGHYLGKSPISLHNYLCEQDVNKLAHYLDNDTSLLQCDNIESLANNFGPYEEIIKEKLEKGKKKRFKILKNLKIMEYCNLRSLVEDVKIKIADFQTHKDLANYIL